MRRVVIHKPGGYDRLKVESFEDPRPAADEVVVRTEAVGVNYADVCVRWGVYESAKQFVGWPITPGFEFAGVVQETGAGITHVKKGDPVVGVTFFNGYSTHVRAKGHFVWKRPEGFDAVTAAGFPVVFFTAYHGLLQTVPVRRGMKVLIHSAAGGVGSALVQLCRVLGLESTGVVGSSHKVPYLRELGADHVIDKSSEDLWAAAERIAPEGYDLIYDANGPETLRQSYEHLRATGKVIAYGFHSMLPKHGGRIKYVKAALGMLRIPRFNPLHMTNENKSVLAFNLSFLANRADLLNEAAADLLKWLGEGKIRPLKTQVFDLTDVAEAHRALESGKTTGKLVLRT